jgi:hypothetical protein
MSVTLKDEKLLDSWGVVIELGGGRADHLIDTVKQFLQQSELPGITWEVVEVKPGIIKGFFGKKRDYLMVKNEALKDYRMYVGARDYGRHLDISWFLTVEPGFFKKMFSEVLTKGGSPNALSFLLDIFDQQDLRAYVTAVHRCAVRKAVEQVVEHLGQDASKFDWKSKGFLQVW